MSVLKICPSCGTEYPANERFCPRDGTALRSQAGGTDLVGSILAERYHVLRKLGEGGMGEVYLAEHVKMGRRSAVKVMHRAMVNDADAIGRFNREAANASRINHPNVAGIYDFGETSDGLVYLAMEYIEGETLTELLTAAGALPPARAAEITRQVAEALHVAHEMGIVHRDLKPDNIMLTKDHDGDDRVKVVDFGIAKAADGDSQKVTRTGMVVGTPEYMSPEQLSGDALDGRSDLYSLALVAFNMLTGKLPFPSETTQSAMIMRLTEKPRPLSQMKPDVAWPPALQAVMDRALERDAALRYQKPREFARALVAATGDVPVTVPAVAGTLVMTPPSVARVPEPRDPAGRRVHPTQAARNRTPVVLGALALVAVAGGGAFFFMSRPTHGAAAAPTPPAAAPPAATPGGATPSVPVPSEQAVAPAAPAPLAAPEPASVPETSSAMPVPGAASVASRSAADSVALAHDLRAALSHASVESTAPGAVKEADRLESRAVVAEERVMVALVRAQAYGTLGQDAKSCAALREGVVQAKGTAYEARLSEMVARCR